MTVLFSPHADDETLFASFTILRHRPHVVVCYPSAGDYGSTETRTAETREAVAVLGGASVEQWQGGDIAAQMRAFDAREHPARVWAPDIETTHLDHVMVAWAASDVFGERLTTYHTYIGGKRVTRGREVSCMPEWVPQKLRALLCYSSQMTHPRAYQFFLHDQREFYGVER